MKRQAIIADVVGIIAAMVILPATSAEAGFPRGKLPDFEVRFKLTPAAGTLAPEGGYWVALDATRLKVAAPAGEWGPYLKITDADMNPQSSKYPNANSKTWPARIMFTVHPAAGVIFVEVESVVGGRAESSQAELVADGHGSARLGFALLWDWEKKGRVMTLGSYNDQFYWDAFKRHADQLPEAYRNTLPGKILLADEFRLGDSDRRALRKALEGMRTLGINAIYLTKYAGASKLLDEAKIPFMAGASYQPPAIMDTGGQYLSDDGLKSWAGKIRGIADPQRMGLFIMSDEPGWYYPSMYDSVNGSEKLLARFHAYLCEQGLTTGDVGATSWDGVRMRGMIGADDLPARKLAYWSQRFIPHESALFFARCTRALEEAFYPGMPVAVNWNFFAGRCYAPGGSGNNPKRNHPEAAMAGHDWFEFGRLRGATCLWTEDWFSDDHSWQWSYYSEKLRSASPTGSFGGYIVPRSAGGRPDGLVYKTLALAGHGAKQIKYFAFGPEYEFPGNCWSQAGGHFAAMVKATRVVGAAEALLYPGKPLPRQVGILHHLSAQMWDKPGIIDATNPDMNRSCAAYSAEMFDLYLALMHAQVPVEFLSEEDVIAGAKIGNLKVLYVTAPNVPEEAQKVIAGWVAKGGILFTTSWAAAFDRYDVPCGALDKVRGVKEQNGGAKNIFGNVWNASMTENHSGELGGGPCAYTRGTLTLKGAEVVSRYGDGSPAATRNRHGKGAAIHAGFMPGISYLRTFTRQPASFLVPGERTDDARRFILAPIEMAGVQRPVDVDRPFVEVPVLASEKGMAVTVLNWNNAPQRGVKLRIRTARPVRSVTSALGAAVTYSGGNDQVDVAMDIATVDVLLVQY